MTTIPRLTLSLTRIDAGRYGLEMELLRPDSQAAAQLLGGQPAEVALNLQGAPDPLANLPAYGQWLCDSLFATRAAYGAFTRARAAVGAGPLRLCLRVAHNAPELHRLAWELLADPDGGAPLAMQEPVWFSRVLLSTDSRPVTLPAGRGQLSALLAVASPADAAEYDLAPVDPAAETARVQAEMSGLQVRTLPTPLVLESLLAALEEDTDILYLICHGRAAPAGYVLYLEDRAGKTQPVKGDDFLRAMSGLAHPPRLLVTPACQSAEAGPANEVAFAARLAEAGIPAVLAMQISFSQASEARFMPAFFAELVKDGQIDRAAGLARRLIAGDRPDAWAPALLTCLNDGRIWVEGTQAQTAGKYTVNAAGAKGVVVGDHATVTMNFDDK